MSQKVYQTEKTRQKILREAEICFSENGFFETQMIDVARAIGMSRNTLYRYYHDKVDLAFAILEMAILRLGETTSAQLVGAAINESLIESSALDQFMRVLDGLLSPDSQSVDERFMAEFDAYFSGSRITEPLRQRLASTVTLQGYFELTRLIELGQREGCIRTDIKAELLNVTVINATRALQQRLILRGQALVEATPEDLQQMNAVHIQLLCDGLRPPPANKKKN